MDFSEDSASRELFFVQYQEPALVPILTATLGPGACFYDVGANIGVYTLWAAALVGGSGEVHAFEPVPATRAMLADLVDKNRAANVNVVGAAVGDREGSVLLQVPVGASGLGSAVPRRWDVPVHTVESPLTTLDNYVRTHRPPDLVKIDVEGFELSVLKGMTNLLRDSRPMVVLEVLDAHLRAADTSIADIQQHFAGYGYSIWNLTRRGIREFGDQLGHSQNVLAAHAGDHDGALNVLRRARFRPNQTL
ncbi:MAG TPA: FkbM family methyltransferase [Acidimicrobiales bacterium]|nr:FkbM family methyltransferase [Acidimicrobiales bacterium]